MPCPTGNPVDAPLVSWLHAYETMSAAREGIGRCINFYNTRRPHSSHQAQTRDVGDFASLYQPSTEAA